MTYPLGHGCLEIENIKHSHGHSGELGCIYDSLVRVLVKRLSSIAVSRFGRLVNTPGWLRTAGCSNSSNRQKVWRLPACSMLDMQWLIVGGFTTYLHCLHLVFVRARVSWLGY